MAEVRNAASAKHQEQMQRLADFLDLNAIEYTDLGNGEDYVLTKDGGKIVLQVRGNKDQGGFLAVSELTMCGSAEQTRAASRGDT